MEFLAGSHADNRSERLITADLDLSLATRKYAQDSLRHPRFLSAHWRRMLKEMRSRVRIVDQIFRGSIGQGKAS